MDLPLSKKACGRQPSDRRGMFNVAFEVGGPVCTVAAAERLTGLQVDNVLVVDFSGFRRIVDAIGGLRVCLNHAVHDRKALLDLPAGTRKLGGKDTLALMRARKSLGDKSDIGRTARQQYLLTETVAQVRSGGLLHKPAKLYRVASAATKSLTTDKGLGSVDALLDLAEQLSGVEEDRIHLTTLPWLPDPQNPENTIVMDEEKAAPFLRSMDRDQEPGVKRTKPAATATTTPPQPGEPTPTERPAKKQPTTTTTTATDPTVKDLFCDVS
jgi:LCP family protein required for cell wall assembly